MLTSALWSGCLTTTSVAETTQSRSPGVSSAAFCAQSPDLRFACLMDMDFAVSCPLVPRSRLISDSCPSTRAFAPRFLQTSPRSDSPCVLANPSPPSGWVEDFHFQAAEHAQHTTKPLARRTLRVCRGRDGISLFSRGTKASLRLMFTSLVLATQFRSIATNPARPISYN